ncbi:hypothetical protein SDRG_11166 [Saprolegnia diclina VS20]|uniref:CBM1 domain-containing protein n=1 Tax=Saprolegnia diclina (strain VS20) TaxID=1156394 RepID=T0RMP7_SAPDV|nr:hypothetical protein SDRG_11163 [Saprolegnia diclina VS20]XP_008615418.1 hypothetical protein SDRG_11166 [Saprolegnia diclina VS20]EQC31242.1 hypothetical protein SDRG_11163 [Saprolegnia diclina VS20]EQC31245.1 hypothetical protein SDRG_11166 [Saprolegnia diclina VS20]|eukprot:XP_008615415.1 hypothetical protein SDRG_11163 [Saprolegnia diclina VS20]
MRSIAFVAALVMPIAAVSLAAAPTCSEKWSQCNGQNWPFGVCCKDPTFVCNKKNDYLSLCEPKKKAEMAAEAAEINVWGQCGGNGFSGNYRCADGSSCIKVNDAYSQCQPTPPGANEIATWGQCGGSNNNFKANGKTCRSVDTCKVHNSYYSQCVPK